MNISPPVATIEGGLRLPLHAAERLYHVSRDLYAPVLTAFAARCLDSLRADRATVNVCLARDGISPFLAQQTLLRNVPDRFMGITAQQVRLVYLSRQLVRQGRNCSATRELVEGYLQGRGLQQICRVNLIDVGIHGSIQDELQDWYPQSEIRGHYLIYHRRLKDALATQKEGFLVGDSTAANESGFLHRPVIHLLEDLWNGVYESVTALRLVAAGPGALRVRPELVPLGGRTVLAPETLRRLKRVALQGVVDGVAQVARQRANAPLWDAGAAAWNAAQRQRLAEWIAASRESGSPDAWLWRMLIRPDHDTSEITE